MERRADRQTAVLIDTLLKASKSHQTKNTERMLVDLGVSADVVKRLFDQSNKKERRRYRDEG